MTTSIRNEYFDEGYPSSFPFPDLPFVLTVQNMERGEDTGNNRHEDFYALYVIGGGSGLHVINEHPYNLMRGDVYIALPGSVHAYRKYLNLYADVLCFQTDIFSPAQLEALRSLPGFWNLRVQDFEQEKNDGESVRKHRFHLTPERHREVETMINEIRNEIAHKHDDPPVTRTLIPLLFFRLLVFLSRAQGAQQQVSIPTAHDAGIAHVIQICEERFCEPLSVPQLAATMYLSPGRFSEVFSAHMGIAPAAYIRRLRLERAQTLLRNSNHQAATVAMEVGFNDPAQFSRAFRSAFGITPSQYRSRFKR